MTAMPGAGTIGPPASPSLMMTLVRGIGHQRWIHYGTRFRLAQRLLAGEMRAHREFEAPFYGMRYRGDLASYIDWSVFVFGVYEEGMLYFLRDAAGALGGGIVYVDVGANVGQHTLYMSRFAAAVHAFEPYEPVRRRIAEKIADNRLANVTVHAVGLGATEARLPFYAPVGPNQGQGTFVAALGAAAGPPAGTLEVARADDWFPRHGIDRVDLVKIDVEGFEPQVLAGMRAVIARCRPVIVMEYLPETKTALGGEAGLRRLVPEDYDVHGLAIRLQHYRRGPLRADRVHYEVVLSPREKTALLPEAGSG